MGLKIPAGDVREVTIPQADYLRLLEAITNPAFKDLVMFTWETGCRPQESLRIEVRHLDLARQRIVLPKAEAKGKRQPRIIYLTATALEIVERSLAAQSEGILSRQTNGKPWVPADAIRQFEMTQIRMGQRQYEQLGIPVPQELIVDLAAKKKPHRKSGAVISPKSFRCEVR